MPWPCAARGYSDAWRRPLRCARLRGLWLRRGSLWRAAAAVAAFAALILIRHRANRAAAAALDRQCAISRGRRETQRAAAEYGGCASQGGWNRKLVVSVLTMDRPNSLSRLLRSLADASPHDGSEGDGERVFREVDVHVWVDRPSRALAPDARTLEVARGFRWARGSYAVHVRRTNAGLARQWLEAWRPTAEDAEKGTVGLIVEDDIRLSPHFERFLIGAYRAYGGRPYVAGVSLQHRIIRASDAFASALAGEGPFLTPPRGHRVFLARLLGSWGFSPHPAWWRRFQAWVDARRAEPRLKPYVPSLLPTRWFQALERAGRPDSMWTAWYIRFLTEQDLFHVFPALPGDRALAVNYREAGEHYSGDGDDDGRPFGQRLVRWEDAGAADQRLFRRDAPHLDWHGFAADVPSFGGACANASGPAPRTPAVAAIARLSRARGGHPVAVTLVNSAFLAMVRSWLCNLASAGIPQPLIAWVALDDASAAALRHVPNSVVVSLREYLGGRDASAGVSWASLGYWRLMLARTRLLRDALVAGVDLLVFEADAVWLRDPWPALRADPTADVTGFATSDEIGGGFLLLRASLRTRQLLADVALLFEGTFNHLSNSCFGDRPEDSHEIKNDQSFLTQLLRLHAESYQAGNPVRFSLLDPDLFVDGRWYWEKGNPYGPAAARPVVINNNWISGTEAKVARAKRWGHWFWDEGSEQCIPRHRTIFASTPP